MDFTLKTYKSLLQKLKTRGFSFYTFSGYLQINQTNEPKQWIILRHDVDLMPENSLQTAKIEHSLGIRSTYFFRIIPETFKPDIIQQIADLGHEIGYHYEDLTLAVETHAFVPQKRSGSGGRASLNDNRASSNITPCAYQLFKTHLEQLRQYVPVKTICMHGSPKSRYDSKDIWKEYDYRELGIIGEPYFDINFDEVLYLTDTGRRWDGWKVSLRDKVPQQETWEKQGLVFHSTKDIIKAAEQNNLPNKIMITTHPQRWTDRPWPWMKELVWQGVKNVVKGILVVRGQKSD